MLSSTELIEGLEYNIFINEEGTPIDTVVLIAKDGPEIQIESKEADLGSKKNLLLLKEQTLWCFIPDGNEKISPPYNKPGPQYRIEPA